MFDVAVVGLGPAGRSLASACVTRGLSVLAIDPDPGADWRPTYGLWADELAGLPQTAVRARTSHPAIRAVGTHNLGRTYLVLDNDATQDALSLDCATVEVARLDDDGVSALAHRAKVVVDARGARPNGRAEQDDSPVQTAYGIVVDEASARPALLGAEALLMDFTPDWAERPDAPDGPASFLYAIPLGEGRMLLEETCLAAAPALEISELKSRLHRRLSRRGVQPEAWENPLDREMVWIPMRGRNEPAPTGAIAIGTAGRGGHLVSGYSVAHSLGRAAELAEEIATGSPPKVDPHLASDLVRSLALRSLLRLDAATTIDLFEGFGRLEVPQQRAFLRRGSSAPSLLGAMWSMFRSMPVASRLRLILATFGPGRSSRR